MEKLLKKICVNSEKVLLIADRPANVPLAESMLKSSIPDSFEVLTVSGVAAGAQALASGDVEAGILYFSLDHESMLKEFRMLRDMAPEIPLLVLTGSINEGLALQMIKEGAEDVLLEGHFDEETVTQAVCFARERKRNS